MKSVTRLYTQFQPKTYDITFDLDEIAMRFHGTVKITGKKVGRPSQRITLHQNGLKITRATIVKHERGDTQSFEVERINNHDNFNEVRLHATTMLYPGEYTVELEYEAPITT